jgi:GntR family transcriptional regulator
MIKFNLDKEVSLSSYDQIKSQLLSAIYCGKIKGEDRLPSIREVAEDLGVNYKTIRKIYLRLAEESYIEIVKGSGAFLLNRGGEGGYEQMRRQAIFKLLRDVEKRAASLGMPAEKFIRLFESFSSGRNLKKLHLAVIDHEEEAFIFSRELKMRLGAKATSVSLAQVQGNGADQLLEDCDYFLTTSWHMEEVKPLAEHYGKQVVEIKPSHEIYREILMAAQSRNVAVVIQDEETMHASQEIFMNIFHPSTEKQFWIAPIHREDLIEEIIQEAELIFVSPMCWDEMRRRTPAEKELKTYENFISGETIDHLKELQLLT